MDGLSLQVALAVVETLQRNKDSTWDELSAVQKVRQVSHTAQTHTLGSTRST